MTAATTELTIHPAAELFPEMAPAEFEAFVADIQKHGQRSPVVVHQGVILDGRHRYRACLQLGVQPVTTEWAGEGTPEEFVTSMNLHRRHLTGSQRALIAARLATLRQGERQVENSTSLTLPQVARMLDVHRTMVAGARTVLKHGTPEEIGGVEAGKLAVMPIATAIRQGVPAAERKAVRDKKAAAPMANRIETTRQNTLLWQNLKAAFLAISNLPLPADMVPVVRAWDRSKITDQHLLKALKWLEAFAEAWTRDDRDEA